MPYLQAFYSFYALEDIAKRHRKRPKSNLRSYAIIRLSTAGMENTPKNQPQNSLKRSLWRRAITWFMPPAGLSRWKRWLAYAALGSILFLAILAGLLAAFLHELPLVPSIDAPAPNLSTRIYDQNGKLITQLAIENRTLIEITQVPKDLVNAIVALEDQNFWTHWGIDVEGIIRALIVNIQSGRVVQGASTITQQLAKNLFLTRERSLERKAKEALLALQIEKRYTKEEILTMYLNQIYFGNGAYGVEAASRTYFGKHVQELNLSECALLAAIPRSPNQYNPINDPAKAKQRRDVALKSMLDMRFIQDIEYQAALNATIQVFEADAAVASFFVEEVRKHLEQVYGTNAVYKGGLSVYTTLDLEMQDAAQRAAERGAQAADAKAIPYLEHEFSLKEKPTLQIAFLAMDPKSGAVRAMIGGRDFKKSQFNRSTQALRQPGSAFKPFIYAAAIDNGFTPSDTILDAPQVYRDQKGNAWKPENFDHEFKGPTTLHNALADSRNIVTVKLLEKIGTYNAVNYAHKMGIRSRMNRDLTLALGTSEVTLQELVTGFATLANQGVRVDPWFIQSVRDSDGKLLEEASPQAQEVMPAATAYVVVNMMKDVLNGGTGNIVRQMGFMRPAAGKTGTTSDFSDAWFVGFTPDLVAGCWFGYDQRRRIGKLLTGGAIAAPVWTEFMLRVTARMPNRDFPVPQGVSFVKVCAETGKPQPGPSCRKIIDEAFVEGSAPSADAGPGNSDTNLEDFYQNELGKGVTSSPKTQAPKAPEGGF